MRTIFIAYIFRLDTRNANALSCDEFFNKFYGKLYVNIIDCDSTKLISTMNVFGGIRSLNNVQRGPSGFPGKAG